MTDATHRARKESAGVQPEGSGREDPSPRPTTPAGPSCCTSIPKDDTPGCTKEACAFRDNLPRFKSSKAVVLGVSILDEASKARFAGKYDLTFPLLADADHAVAEKYGVWQKRSLYGRIVHGHRADDVSDRPDGKVAKRWDNVKVDGHAEEVLAAVDSALSRRCS